MRCSGSSMVSAQTQRQVIRNYVMDYCSTSTIHGIRYFTEGRRHWTERCWWVIAICLSMWFCCSSIKAVWIKWQDHPVTMNLIEEPLPISTIPFPTVIVCPSIKTNKSKLDLNRLYHSKVDEWTDYELTRMKSLAHVCYSIQNILQDSNNHFANASDFDLIKDIAPDLEETLPCALCVIHFVPILTEKGLCFAFNMLNSDEIYSENIAPEMLTVKDRRASNWSLENGNSDIAIKNTYPFHFFSSKSASSLAFIIRSFERDVENICSDTFPVYQLYLHTPGNVVFKENSEIVLSFNELITIEIKPTMTTTAEGLRKYKPSKRQCYFGSERQLRFFKFYTEENCEIECLANYTVQECGCVKFSMPRNGSTNICGPARIMCYYAIRKRLFEEDIIDGLSNEDAKSFRRNCNCLPACTTITYDAEVDRTKIVRKIQMNSSLGTYYESRIWIAFKHHQISALRREEKYTNTDFLAICGGILGVCLGVSALSVIEFIYYSTLRLFWLLCKWKSENAVVPFKSRPINHVFIDIDMPAPA